MIHGNAVEPGIGLDELIDLPIQMKNAGPGCCLNLFRDYQMFGRYRQSETSDKISDKGVSHGGDT